MAYRAATVGGQFSRGSCTDRRGNDADLVAVEDEVADGVGGRHGGRDLLLPSLEFDLQGVVLTLGQGLFARCSLSFSPSATEIVTGLASNSRVVWLAGLGRSSC